MEMEALGQEMEMETNQRHIHSLRGLRVSFTSWSDSQSGEEMQRGEGQEGH